MKGYVKNKSPLWRHALKRSIGPGEKIPLDDLYKAYGVKHDIIEGQPFVNWLREVKLRDNNVWEIIYEDNSNTVDHEIDESRGVSEINKPKEENKKQQTPFVKTDMTPEQMLKTADSLALLSVRKLKEVLDDINDVKLLKYTLNRASQLQNKDTVCMMLRKRIQTLDISRRL